MVCDYKDFFRGKIRIKNVEPVHIEKDEKRGTPYTLVYYHSSPEWHLNQILICPSRADTKLFSAIESGCPSASTSIASNHRTSPEIEAGLIGVVFRSAGRTNPSINLNVRIFRCQKITKCIQEILILQWETVDSQGCGIAVTRRDCDKVKIKQFPIVLGEDLQFQISNRFIPVLRHIPTERMSDIDIHFLPIFPVHPR